MSKLRIHSIETLGTHDGPGLRMIVFTQGCLLRCLYCHNPDTLELSGGHEEELNSLVRRAVSQKHYFGEKGGVTVSGGEPTLHRRILKTFFEKLHAEEIHTCLDTNGIVFDDDLRALYEETDLVILDIKHIDDQWHRRLTGVPNTTPLDCAAWRESTGKPMWLRYVFVPGWTDQEEFLHKWGAHFASYKTVERVEILPYHRLGVHKWASLGMDYKLGEVDAPTPVQLAEAKEIFQKYFQKVILK